MEDIVSIVSNCGFPVLCSVLLFRHLEKEREAHKQEIDNTVKAINNNTTALMRLSERLEGSVDVISQSVDSNCKSGSWLP